MKKNFALLRPVFYQWRLSASNWPLCRSFIPMEKSGKIYVAGHRGMVGSALLRALQREGYGNLVYRTSAELDLRNQAAVNAFFESERPDYVLLAAAKVGGIMANSTYKAEFIYDNLLIAANVIHAAYTTGVKKLLFLGSSCIYPRMAPQPLKEEYLLTGLPEPSNEPYAIAKIAGIKLCQYYYEQYGCRFMSVLPCNLYGPGDQYDLQQSHVLPALIRRFHEAKQAGAPTVTLWGTGHPLREFLYVDDLADACLHVMNEYDEMGMLNIGSGTDISIKELAGMIRALTGYGGDVVWDSSKPDGTPRKLLDTTKINALGWRLSTSLEEGLPTTYQDYLQQLNR
jgi:GDP-L-fucose synthase